jgi:fluoroquinolone transport system permease protein
MSRFGAALRLEDLLLQFRYGFYYAAALTTLVWITLLSALPESVLSLVVPFMIFADLAVVGYYFIAGMVLIEKGGLRFSPSFPPLCASGSTWPRSSRR